MRTCAPHRNNKAIAPESYLKRCLHHLLLLHHHQLSQPLYAAPAASSQVFPLIDPVTLTPQARHPPTPAHPQTLPSHPRTLPVTTHQHYTYNLLQSDRGHTCQTPRVTTAATGSEEAVAEVVELLGNLARCAVELLLHSFARVPVNESVLVLNLARLIRMRREGGRKRDRARDGGRGWGGGRPQSGADVRGAVRGRSHRGRRL
jgi:hypothetical protein